LESTIRIPGELDTIDPKRRSELMSKIRGKNTGPELIVRRLVHSLGYRYRLHAKNLPGKPDLTLARHGAVIFVHGCFWHLHSACPSGHLPSTNQAYWTPKLQRNAERDRTNVRKLRRLGWRVLVLWECQLGNAARLEKRIRRFLEV